MLYDTESSTYWLGVLHSTITEDGGFPVWTSLPLANMYGLAFLLTHVSPITYYTNTPF